MRKTLLLHLIVIVLLSCNNPEPPAGCSKFVTGRFAYHGEISGHDYLIERDGLTQTEYDLTEGSIAKLKIIWLAPCAYELQFLSRQRSPDDTVVEDYNFPPLKVDIIKVEGDH